MNTITIPQVKIEKNGGVVILSLKEYQRLCGITVPTYYLKGKGAKDLDKLVKTGLREFRGGKCRTIKSLADLD